MTTTEITITGWLHTCQRCGKSWISKIKDPLYCPKCKSPGWMRPAGEVPPGRKPAGRPSTKKGE